MGWLRRPTGQMAWQQLSNPLGGSTHGRRVDGCSNAAGEQQRENSQ
jgi:hypothetical protein